ncbi:Vacuolar protein-sorting-associated protein 36 [Balamuthia mandrillaris]
MEKKEGEGGEAPWTRVEGEWRLGTGPTARDLLLPGETLPALTQQSGVQFALLVQQPQQSEEGALVLTSHRLIWTMDASSSHTKKPRMSGAYFLSLPHPNIHKVDALKQTVGLNTDKPTAQVTFTEECNNCPPLLLIFNSGGRNLFLSRWQKVLDQKPWLLHRASSSSTSSSAYVSSSTSSVRSAGVSALMLQMDEKAKRTENSLAQAFTDLNALMAMAKDMVALAQRFKAETLSSSSSASEDDAAQQQFGEYLLSMGIASPVTRESAGSQYHRQLAKELSDFLCTNDERQPSFLERAGGMIALTDLYCIFNRARGTELISPEDLYRACLLLERLSLPIRLHKFESGVLVVQSLSYREEQVAQRIAAFVERQGKCSALDVAKEMSLSLPLATQQLLSTEQRGLLCRDESIEGLFFYPNFFLQSA